MELDLETTFESLSDESKAAFDDGNTTEFADTFDETRSPAEPEGKARDEHGKFVKLAPESPETPEAPEAPAEPETPAAPPAPVEPAVPMPSSWKPEVGEKWKLTPPEVQLEVARREDNFHSELSKYHQATEYAKSWLPLAEPLQMLRQQFGSEQEGVRKLLELSQYAEEHPIEFGKWYMHSQGLTPADLDGPLPERPARFDPKVQDLEREVKDLKAQLGQVSMTQQQTHLDSAVRVVEDFGRDKPDFQTLRAPMASLLTAGIATDLADAYQKARSMLGLADKAKVDEQVAAKMKAAEQAKAKAEVNVPKSGRDAKPGKRKGSMDDTLREIADKLYK